MNKSDDIIDQVVEAIQHIADGIAVYSLDLRPQIRTALKPLVEENRQLRLNLADCRCLIDGYSEERARLMNPECKEVTK